MNRITAVMLSDFCRENHLTALKTDKQFEHFTAHLVLSRFLPDSFDTADVVLGSSGDNALDAIAIIVNGALVTSVEEVADLAARNGYLDATFVFIQADHGPSFHSPKMGEVQLGVEHFFNEESTLPRSPAVPQSRTRLRFRRRFTSVPTCFPRATPSAESFTLPPARGRETRTYRRAENQSLSHWSKRESSAMWSLPRLGQTTCKSFTTKAGTPSPGGSPSRKRA